MAEAQTPTATDGKETTEIKTTEAKTEVTKEQPTADEPLREPGKKALEAEREARSKAEKELKAAQEELTKLRESQMTEQERAIAEARKEARNEALMTANQRIVKAEIKAAAAGKLRNAEIAVRLIPADQFSVSDDGSVDSTAIDKAIADLLDEYPELAPSKGPGTADGGIRQTPAPEVQPGLGRLQYAYSQKQAKR